MLCVHQFQETDPVNLAINCHEEQLAIYLVEKSFSINKLYQVRSSKDTVKTCSEFFVLGDQRALQCLVLKELIK